MRHASVAMAVVDRGFRYVRANALLARLYGLSAEEMVGRRVQDVVPGLWPTLEPLYRAVLAGESFDDLVLLGPQIPGAEVSHFRCSYYPITEAGEVTGIGLVVNEVTEREQMRDALRVRTDLYAMVARTNRAVAERRSVDELYPEICRIAVETGHFLCAWIGVPDQGVVRRVASAGSDGGYLSKVVVTLRDDDPRSHGPIGRALRAGIITVVNDFFADARTRPWHEPARRVGFAAAAAFPLFERGRPVAVLTLYAGQPGFFTPELVEALHELAPSISSALDAFALEREKRRDDAELRLRDRALRAVPQGIVITDPRLPDNPITFVNSGFEQITGYRAAEVIGRNCRFLSGPDTDRATLALLKAAVREGRVATVELLNHRKDGAAFWNQVAVSPVVDERGVLTNFIGVQTDVTERRRYEAHLQQTQKLEAVGLLASGVVHDFNNVLMVIGGCVTTLLELPIGNEAQHEAALDIADAAELATTLTRQLLSFTRGQPHSPQVLELDKVVHASEKMLARLAGPDVRLETRLGCSGWKVKADRGQLEQVLINLVVNARDAMPKGGTLGIESEHSATPPGANVDERDWVCLTVSDTGTGIDPQTRDHIFEPFFTTKEPGRGTGLGLSTVQSIVDQSGGMLALESAVGRGTTFRVYLPRALAEQ